LWVLVARCTFTGAAEMSIRNMEISLETYQLDGCEKLCTESLYR
jgi:hypothetical protein